jgi:hypothetical protein
MVLQGALPPTTQTGYLTRSRFQSKSTDLDISGHAAIDLIASHSYEIGFNCLSVLTPSAIEQILEHENLCVDSEDELFDVFDHPGCEYMGLLCEAKLELMSIDSIDRFFLMVSNETVGSRLWSNIWRGAPHEIVSVEGEPPEKRYRFRGRHPESPACGLIDHFTIQCGGNAHERGIVEIICSSTAQSWIQFDFKDRNVSVIRYAITPHKAGSSFLRQWTLARSSVGASTVKTFGCSREPSSSRVHRDMRLTQSGSDSSGKHHLVLNSLEFLGSFIE